MAVQDIAFFYLDGSWIRIMTLTNQKYIMNSSMELLEKQPQYFFRANRQFSLNRKQWSASNSFFQENWW
ncbi:MAG: hypothetical protein DI539_12210 [Flavobacterium psychrophilum]|nr:MAG: hypothetical protein DI539_12210 [Flavobacterium psychrophilum]